MDIKTASDFIKAFVKYNFVKGYRTRVEQQDFLDELYSFAIQIQFQDRNKDPYTFPRENLFVNNYISWFEDQDFDKIKKQEKVTESLNRLVNRADLCWIKYFKEEEPKKVTVKRKKISKYI
jgi:hypothetical protein